MMLVLIDRKQTTNEVKPYFKTIVRVVEILSFTSDKVIISLQNHIWNKVFNSLSEMELKGKEKKGIRRISRKQK